MQMCENNGANENRYVLSQQAHEPNSKHIKQKRIIFSHFEAFPANSGN